MSARRIKLLVIASLALGLLVFLLLALRPQAVEVELIEIRRGPMQVMIEEDGQTRIREIYRLPAPVSGHLQRITAKVGDPVIAGQTLIAQLLPTSPGLLDQRAREQAQAGIRAAESALQAARADTDRARGEDSYARKNLQRVQQLAIQDSISGNALDQAELAARSAHSQLQAREAAVALREAELLAAQASLQPLHGASSAQGVVDIRAPVNGRILQLHRQSAGPVAVGQALVDIGDPGALEIIVDLLSRDAVQVRIGAEVRIEDWGGAYPLRGRVQQIEPAGYTRVSALGIEEQRVNVIIDLLEPPSRWQGLGHGFRIDAKIAVWQAEEVLQVPTGALFRQDTHWAVFVDRQGRAALQHIEIGQNNGRVAEVLAGLEASERVVLHPSERITHNTRISPRSR